MSQNASYAAPSPPGHDGSASSAGEGLILCASVLGVLIVLVIIRYGVNLCLDIFVLGNLDMVKRSVAEAWRKLCPWWHRRTVPSDFALSTSSEQVAPVQQQINRPLPIGSAELIQQIVERNSCKLTPREIQEWTRDQQSQPDLEAPTTTIPHAKENETVSCSMMICSICLHEFCEEDMVFRTSCRHFFHSNCMADWLKSSGTDCPYCRRWITASLDESNRSQ